MIAGLKTVNSGHVMIGQKAVNEVEPKNRDIAMVFQNSALCPHSPQCSHDAGMSDREPPRKVELSSEGPQPGDLWDVGSGDGAHGRATPSEAWTIAYTSERSSVIPSAATAERIRSVFCEPMIAMGADG
jgi:ABC-type Fe3+/spermidine/putrescine transport system ATPase subunit